MYTPVPHSGIQYDQGIGQDVNQFAEESSSEKKAIDEHYSDSPSSVTYVQSDPTKPRLVANNPKVKSKKGKTEKGKVPDLHITASNGNESSFISTPPRNSNNKEKIQTVSKDKELELLLVSDKAESGALNERTKTTPVSPPLIPRPQVVLKTTPLQCWMSPRPVQQNCLKLTSLLPHRNMLIMVSLRENILKLILL